MKLANNSYSVGAAIFLESASTVDFITQMHTRNCVVGVAIVSACCAGIM